MSLIPAATFTLGNLRYDVHAADVRGTLAFLPGANRFQVTLPAGVRLDATPGEEAILELDGGEGAVAVLTGKVHGLRRKLTETIVSLVDAGADLATIRSAATYERQSGSDVIRALAAEAGSGVGNLDLDLPLASYVAHQGMTAAEHIAYLARLGGGLAAIDGDGDLQVVDQAQDRPQVALLYGREIVACEIKQQSVPAARRVVVGSGPAGSTDAPDAMRQTLQRLPGNAPAAGKDAVWQPAAILRTPGVATEASSAAETAVAAQGQVIQADCFLLPGLRPGMVIEVQELPESLSGGPWLLNQVKHSLRSGQGGRTSFVGQSAGDAGGSLLGAALSAVGSLS